MIKRPTVFVFIFIAFLFLLNGCRIEKRHYMDGYHVEMWKRASERDRKNHAFNREQEKPENSGMALDETTDEDFVYSQSNQLISPEKKKTTGDESRYKTLDNFSTSLSADTLDPDDPESYYEPGEPVVEKNIIINKNRNVRAERSRRNGIRGAVFYFGALQLRLIYAALFGATAGPGLATFSAITGLAMIAGLVLAIKAFVQGVRAKREIRERPGFYDNEKDATIGKTFSLIVLGFVATVVVLAIIILFLFLASYGAV